MGRVSLCYSIGAGNEIPPLFSQIDGSGLSGRGLVGGHWRRKNNHD